MRRFTIAVAALAALAALTGAVALGGGRAEAMSLPAPLAGVTQQTEEVRLVCTTRRVGHRWVKSCRDVRPHYHRRHHHHHRHHHRHHRPHHHHHR
ncbi:hypothetical protein YH63_016350 [Afipia massiliensis]|uniref:Uncharacterized protein n=1 Tax=Afipia massiliensis TaxID=211460 RepID=A0A4U6BUM4_9BRAD|nr:hypothetical protein YH63_016350 [Afipia massiliensis]